MSTRSNLLTLVPDVDLKWSTWVDYFADPRYADHFPVFDDFVYAVTYERTPDEFIFTSDEVSLYTGFTRAPADTTTLADIFTFDATYIRAFADPMVVTDDITLILGTTANVNYADAVAMTEVFGTALTMPRSLADSVAMSEAFSSISTVVLNVADVATMYDVGQNFDSYWPYVEALFHFDAGSSANGGNNLNWIDSSPYNKTVLTSTQLPFQGTVSPYVGANTSFADYSGIGGSAYFGAVGTDSLYSPQSDHFHFPPGTDFTIECWVYITDNSPPDYNGDRTACILSTYPTDVHHGGWTINLQGVGGSGVTGANAVYLEKVGPGGSTYDAVVAGGISQRKWHHIAVCRAGTVTRIFLDGVLGVTQTMNDQDVLANGPLVLGRDAAPGINRYFKGYIADVRISKGAAYYVSNFTPPTTKTDGSSLATAIKLEFSNAAVFDSARKSDMHLDGTVLLGTGPWGSPAIYFDGNSRNVQTPFALSVAERFAVMDRDFTMECWFWLAGDSPVLPANGIRDGTLMTTWPNGAAASGLLVYIIGNANTTGDGIACSISDTNGNAEYCTYWGAITKNAWHHVAFSRTGGNLYLHYDGVMVITTPASKVVATPATPPYAGPLLLGMTAYPGWAMAFNGYIDDFRFTIGKGRYGATNFGPPNAPFPNGVAAYTDVYNRVFSDSVTMSEAGTFDMPASTTFDPALVGSVITLSGGNLIASRNSGAQYNCARSTTGKTTGKWYAEMKPVAGSSGDIGFGVGRASFALTATYPGSAAPSVGFRNNGFGNNDGTPWASGAADLTVPNGGTVCIAVDASAGLVWLGKNGAPTWNNNPAADPATGVGGLVLSGSGAIHLLTGMYTPPDQVSLNCGQSAFVHPIPVGFSRWG